MALARINTTTPPSWKRRRLGIWRQAYQKFTPFSDNLLVVKRLHHKGALVTGTRTMLARFLQTVDACWLRHPSGPMTAVAFRFSSNVKQHCGMARIS